MIDFIKTTFMNLWGQDSIADTAYLLFVLWMSFKFLAWCYRRVVHFIDVKGVKK